jgi:hypothetical protein
MTMYYRIKVDKLLYSVLFLCAVGLVSVASPQTAWSAYYGSQSSMADFDAFMRDHPKASTDLQNNPNLIYDNRWLRSHPEVEHYLKKHPEVRETIAYRRGSVYRSRDRYDERYDWRPPYYRVDPRDRWPYHRDDPRDRRWEWHRR